MGTMGISWVVFLGSLVLSAHAQNNNSSSTGGFDPGAVVEDSIQNTADEYLQKLADFWASFSWWLVPVLITVGALLCTCIWGCCIFVCVQLCKINKLTKDKDDTEASDNEEEEEDVEEQTKPKAKKAKGNKKYVRVSP